METAQRWSLSPVPSCTSPMGMPGNAPIVKASAVETRLDLAAGILELEPLPLEFTQFRSRLLRYACRALFWLFWSFVFIYITVVLYRETRAERYISLQRDGDCDGVTVGAYSGRHRMDGNGAWDTHTAYSPDISLYVVEFQSCPPAEYAAAMRSLAASLEALTASSAARTFAENVLVAVTWQASYATESGDGAVTLRFEADAKSLLDTEFLSAGAGGCPSGAAPAGAAAGDDEGYVWAVCGHLARDAARDLCRRTNRFGYALSATAAGAAATWASPEYCAAGKNAAGLDLDAAARDALLGASGATRTALTFDFDAYAILNAAAINAGLATPEDFLQEQVGKDFLIPGSLVGGVDGPASAAYDAVDYTPFLEQALVVPEGGSIYDDATAVEWNERVAAQCGDFSPAEAPAKNGTRAFKIFSDSRHAESKSVLACHDGDAGWVCSLMQGGLAVFPTFAHKSAGFATCGGGDADADDAAPTPGVHGEAMATADATGGWAVGAFARSRIAMDGAVRTSAAFPANPAPGISAAYAKVVDAIGFDLPRSGASTDAVLAAACALAWAPYFFAARFDNAGKSIILNAGSSLVLSADWHCSDAWTRSTTFSATAARKPPYPEWERYYECRATKMTAFVEGVGVAFGWAEVAFCLLSFILMVLVLKSCAYFEPVRSRVFQNQACVTRDDLDNTQAGLLWHIYHTGEVPSAATIQGNSRSALWGRAFSKILNKEDFKDATDPRVRRASF